MLLDSVDNTNDMIDNNELTSRRKRVNCIKIALIVTLLILVLIPTALCIFLGIRMSRLEKKLDSLSSYISMEDDVVSTKEKGNYAYASETDSDESNLSENTYDYQNIFSDKETTLNGGIIYKDTESKDGKSNANRDKEDNSRYNDNNDISQINHKDNKDQGYIDDVLDNDNLSEEVINIEDINTEDKNTEDSNSKNINAKDANRIDTNTRDKNSEYTYQEDIDEDKINLDKLKNNIYNSSIDNSKYEEGIMQGDDLESKDLIYYGKKVYLTFDDGPSYITDQILDILEEYRVKATFFVVGKTDLKSKERYKRIVDEGHTLGIHSYSHKYSEIYNSVEDFDKDFTKLWKLLYDTTGYNPTLYRFPGGSLNYVNNYGMEKFIRYLNEKGIRYYDWNVLNGDAAGVDYTEEQMIENVLDGVKRKRTSIVLMHDNEGKQKTVATLPEILEELISGGAEVLPLDENVPLIQQIKADSVE